eukprot:2322641-Rhodomonas_salina.1
MEKVSSWKDFISSVRHMKPKPTLDEFLKEAHSEDTRINGHLGDGARVNQRRPLRGETTARRTLTTRGNGARRRTVT